MRVYITCMRDVDQASSSSSSSSLSLSQLLLLTTAPISSMATTTASQSGSIANGIARTTNQSTNKRLLSPLPLLQFYRRPAHGFTAAVSCSALLLHNSI